VEPPFLTQSYVDILKYSAANVDWQQLSDTQKIELSEFLWDMTRKACIEDFHTYVKTIAPVLIPGFKSGRHIEVICKELQDLYEAVLRNDKTKSKVQVYLPPESMKTVLCSHLFPSWVLGKHPNWRVIAVGHSADHAAKELGANAKRIVTLPEYQDLFPKTKISRESPGVGFWKTTKGGYYFSGGHGTQFPGKRANILIGDDVVSEHTKPSELKTINHNYGSGLETRLLEDNSGQLIINTRWYLNDLSGYLENRDGGVTPTGVETGTMSDRPWRIVRVPAILDEEAVRLLGENDPRFVVGGSYWPERKSIENLLDAKRRLTPHQWNALYLQSPIPLTGSIFDPKHFERWAHKDPPEVSGVIISLDTAFSEKETKDSAESCYQIWGIFPMKEVAYNGKESVQGNMILLGYAKGHWSFPELKSTCTALYDEYASVLDFFLIENRASGISLIQELREIGLPVIEYNPDRDKISRAHAASAILHNKRVYVNQNLYFTQEFLAELQKFPGGGKDTADAFSQAVIWMRDSWKITPSDYKRYDEDDDNVVSFRRRPKSYWGSVNGRT
jgi:predicted phage terminase large subunit-like protein